ncbi:unnamed protein product [Spirodela intermedia]|uniref:Uncharacterized protein n=1 Tax=Spirodela intermedia TaxID=51605 RepID=A0A7I8IKG5_SPIIN|nr:unnamed protein product [Spirodela intermedia]CAA6657994.1 unnamed protein product [Spirodela intermedia]
MNVTPPMRERERGRERKGSSGFHHILLFFFLILFVGGGVLVLLVLGDEVVHVALCLGELHLVHALAGVPVEEGLAAVHGGELLADPPEHLLDGGGYNITNNDEPNGFRTTKGSTTVSETLGEGKTENVSIIRSGYSSLIFEISRVPIPDPAVAVLGLLAHNIENRIDQLSPLRVVPLGPVVAGAGLAEDVVVRPEDLAERPRSDGVHGSRLQIHEHRPGTYLPPLASLYTCRWIDPVLVADHLPELGPDLVPALAPLDMKDLPHLRLDCYGHRLRRESGGAGVAGAARSAGAGE